MTPQQKSPNTLAGAAEARIIDRVRTLRQAFWEHGYRPVAIWSPGTENDKGEPIVSAGKRPVGHDWRQKALRDPPAAVTSAVSSVALNTGILADQLAAVDIDVPVQPLADKIVHCIERRLGPTPLVRIGRAPKILLVYRRETPHPKLITPELYLPDGSEDEIKVQVEVLGEGQQFVADGIHPDTRKPYTWTDGSPADTPIVDLPIVTEDMLRDMLEEAERLLREAGAVEKEKPPRRPSRDPSQGGSDFFRNVNTAALANIERWVKELYPTAQHQPATGAWRVSSTDLGRSFEEDLSIHPEGIQDFGTEESLTPIDVVICRGAKAKAIEAALWLCERLGFAPESLGWSGGGTPPPPPPGIAKPGTEGVTLHDFYAYMPQHKYIYAPSRELWPPESINGRLPKVSYGYDKSGDPIYVSPARWLDQNRPVEQMTWAPSLPMIIPNRLISEGGLIVRQNVSCFNLYLPPTLPLGDPSQAGPWLDHIWRIYPDHADHLVFWFAHRVQRPQEKCNHAVILGGAPGIGKDSLLEPVKRTIGPWNFREASPTQAMGRFNGFLKAVILRISEAKDLGETDRFKFHEHMKTYIAAPPDVLRCDEKNLREYAIINCCGVVYTTNYKAEGIYLPADDRRHYVAWSSFKKEDFSEQYWKDLWTYYDTGGDGHVAAYLADVDLAGFDAKAPPPRTAAFWDIVNAHRAPEDAELADVLDSLGRPDAVTLRRIIGAAPQDFAEWLQDRRNRPKIPHRFEACGYTPVHNPNTDDGLWRVEGRREMVYGPVSYTLHLRLAAAATLKQKVRQDVSDVSDVSVFSTYGEGGYI